MEQFHCQAWIFNMNNYISSNYVDMKSEYIVPGIDGKIKVNKVMGYLYNYGVYFFASLKGKKIGLAIYPCEEKSGYIGGTLSDSRNMHYVAYIVSRKEIIEKVTSKGGCSFKEISHTHVLDEANCEFVCCL